MEGGMTEADADLGPLTASARLVAVPLFHQGGADGCSSLRFVRGPRNSEPLEIGRGRLHREAPPFG